MTKLIKILESVLVEDLTDNELASEGNDQKLDKYLRLIFKQMKKKNLPFLQVLVLSIRWIN